MDTELKPFTKRTSSPRKKRSKVTEEAEPTERIKGPADQKKEKERRK
jgi:hypothetical protein